jgi:Family of unknown function (DUF6166)
MIRRRALHMVMIAAKDQAQEDLLNRELSDKLTFSEPGSLVRSHPGARVAFLGYSVWRREENGDGNLSDEQVFVIREGRVLPLDPRTDLANHSPDGLSWGYPGSGCAQLALAMLMAIFDEWERVRPIYQLFKDEFVSRLPQDTNWTADGVDILLMALALERRRRL